MINIVQKYFLKGLIVIFPVSLTLYLLIYICFKAENFFGGLIKAIVGENLYLPGFGMALTFLLIILVGVLVSNYITGRLINYIISYFEKIPFIKAIYNPLKDLMALFSNNGSNRSQRVVFVHFENLNMQSIGLLTREEFSDLPDGSVESDRVAVYIPMSYMLGGFTAIVPRKNVTECNIPVDQAIKLAITGWIKSEKPINSGRK
jgi:uncharacterized membrane protein